jgi:hypothetical protein
MIDGVSVRIDSFLEPPELADAVSSLVAGGPFALERIERRGHELHDCTFRTLRPGMSVSYRNVIDLQHRLHRELDIVRVEPLVTTFCAQKAS